ncbi:MAG: aspartate carbamoyltransferase catalytic subunit [Pseudomonadota bacterium]
MIETSTPTKPKAEGKPVNQRGRSLAGVHPFPYKHLLGITGLHPHEIEYLLNEAEDYIDLMRADEPQPRYLAGLTQINLFFENSTRTLMSFDIAGQRLGASTINVPVSSSSIRKGETLLDTALTLNAMHPDILIVRHSSSGAVQLLAEKVDCAVINAGDGRHEHPTQALLDALTIRRRKGKIEGLVVAICGDIANSRVARSNAILLTTMGAEVRLIAPPTLMPTADLGYRTFTDMRTGLEGADVVMMLRLQRERMAGSFVPSEREYFELHGLTEEKLRCAKDDCLVMHPGPMNRGVEIATTIADDISRSAIQEQVEMGVAVRMAMLDILTRELRGAAF